MVSAVDAGRDLRLLARDQGAGDEQAIDEFAPDRGDDGDRRRLDRARLIGCGGLRRRAGADLPGAIFAISAGGIAQGATALAAQTPPSAATATTTTMIRARLIVRPPRRARRVWRQRAGEQSLEDADRHRRLRLGIEIGLDRHALEKTGDESEEEPRAETRIEPRRRRAAGLRRVHELLQPRQHVGVDRPRDLGHARVAAGLGPDLDDQPRLLRRLAEHMFAQARADRLHDIAVAGHQLGEGLGALLLIDRAQTLDDRLFGREIAVEIAGAHAELVGDMLHGRGVKAVADEGALGALKDALAPLDVRRPPP